MPKYSVFQVAKLLYSGMILNGMIGVSRCRYKTYLPLHFGQTTAKSAGVFSEVYSSGINSDSFFASRLTANAIFFAIQFGFGNRKKEVEDDLLRWCFSISACALRNQCL